MNRPRPPDNSGSGADTTGVQFGLMNAMKTGNIVLDTLICFLIPAVLPLLATMGQALLDSIRDKWATYKAGNFAYRTISSDFLTTQWGSKVLVSREERNDVLQRAVQFYITHLNIPLESCDITFADRDESREYRYSSKADRVKSFAIKRMPTDGAYIDIRPGLSICQQERVDSDAGESRSGENKSVAPGRSTVTFTLKSALPEGDKRIDDFLQECIDWYVKELEAMNDDSRYLYILQNKSKDSSGSSGGGRDYYNDDSSGGCSSGFMYKRYKLHCCKTFENLFIKNKSTLETLVDHFINKTGKYAIKGYPHKLGLLFHGPPGTGKTSLIKALGDKTQRAVVQIDLCKITTNQELMDVLFDQRYSVAGEDFPVNMSYEQVIFVMEDVDAATEIVLSRKTESPAAAAASSSSPSLGATAADAIVAQVLAAGTDTAKETTETAVPKTESASESEGLVNLLIGKSSKYDDKKSDKLNLSGLLNALDGIVDTPGRFLIMTSNHPEKLDDALIRPGRIDKVIELGFIEPDQAIELVKYYFPEDYMTEAQELQFSGIIAGEAVHLPQTSGTSGALAHKFTPAELEQYCAECESISALIQYCHDLSVSFVEKNLPPGVQRQVSLGGTVRYEG